MNSESPDENHQLTFALIMPTLDEIGGMHHVWSNIDASLFDEILVVDGGSTDGTLEFCEEHGIRVLMQKGVGMPNALDEGYAQLTSDIIVVFSPDGNSLAEKLPELCDKMREGFDMVVVSRYLGDAYSADDDGITGPGNWVAPRLVNLLFGSDYSDVLCMYRGYRREAIEEMGLYKLPEENWLRRNWWYMNSWEVTGVCRAARLGLNVGQIPGIEPKRVGGERKISILKHGTGVLITIAHEFLLFWKKRTSPHVL